MSAGRGAKSIQPSAPNCPRSEMPRSKPRHTQVVGLRCRCLTICLLAFSVLGRPVLVASPYPIREIVSALRLSAPHKADTIDARVSPSVSRDLTRLKRVLLDVIIATVSAADAAIAPPELLQARTIERIEGEGVPVGDEGGFGVISGIRFCRPKEHPDWLIATTSLGIPYGVDTSVYIFETQGGAWKHVLTLESNGYTDISGAQGWLTYYVVSAEPDKRPYLVTAEVTPWPTSVWQALRLRVLGIGERPDKPIVVARRTLSYCLDEPYHIKVHGDRFELIYLSNAVDPALAGFRGVRYLEYRVGEDGAHILSERAMDPDNVMNRWAAEDWRVASRSVLDTALESAQVWHKQFRNGAWACGLRGIRLAERSNDDRRELAALLACTHGHERTPSAYVMMAASNGRFRIASISRFDPDLKQPAGYIVYCAGSAGVTEPIPDSTPAPRSGDDVPARIANDANLHFSIVVNEDGTVGAISIHNWPAKLSDIVMPAVRAVRQWRYKPGLKDGHPAKVSTDVRILFEN